MGRFNDRIKRLEKSRKARTYAPPGKIPIAVTDALIASFDERRPLTPEEQRLVDQYAPVLDEIASHISPAMIEDSLGWLLSTGQITEEEFQQWRPS